MEIFKWVNLSNCVERRGGRGNHHLREGCERESLFWRHTETSITSVWLPPFCDISFWKAGEKSVIFNDSIMSYVCIQKKKKKIYGLMFACVEWENYIRRERHGPYPRPLVSFFWVSDSSPTLVTLASSVRDSRNIFHTDTHTHTQMKLRWHIELTRYFYSLVIAYNVSFSNCWRMDRALHLECPSTLLTSR